MNGNIFDIQRFCVHDGPGIRTTVFFKGCPLRCIWCHNPESQKAQKSVAFYKDKCALCGACARECHNDGHLFEDGKHVLKRSGCDLCGKCVQACPLGALEMLGRTESAESVMDEVLRDKIFYKNSGGGMTVSGGEPLMQGDFLLELLRSAKENGVHTCIETCGFGSRETLIEAAKYTDIFLFDIKETEDTRHKELTGVPFAPIKENLMLLNSLGAKVILRCPLVPGINVREEHIEQIAKIATELDGLIEVNVMAYHLLGSGKYDALDMENKMLGTQAMSKEEKDSCIDAISKAITRISGKTVKVC